jgi:hypothetical protein
MAMENAIAAAKATAASLSETLNPEEVLAVRDAKRAVWLGKLCMACLPVRNRPEMAAGGLHLLPSAARLKFQHRNAFGPERFPFPAAEK